MCDGIALTWRDLPDVLVSQHDLAQRAVTPGEAVDRQYHFLHCHAPRLLPVWLQGQLRVLPWGGAAGSRLPSQGICRQESLERGDWNWLRPQQVIIPAPLVKDGGRWFDVREGLYAMVVKDRNQHWHAYLITQPASHYYRNMTRRNRMPVFVGKDF